MLSISEIPQEKITAILLRSLPKFVLASELYPPPINPPFMDKLSKSDEKTKRECWEAQIPAKNPRVEVKDKGYYVHRIMYHLYIKKDIPDDCRLRRFCENKRCINPFHLYEQTFEQFNKDQAFELAELFKKRWAGIPPEKVRKIRELYYSSQLSQRLIALEVGVSQQTVHKVVTGKRHVNIQ